MRKLFFGLSLSSVLIALYVWFSLNQLNKAVFEVGAPSRAFSAEDYEIIGLSAHHSFMQKINPVAYESCEDASMALAAQMLTYPAGSLKTLIDSDIRASDVHFNYYEQRKRREFMTKILACNFQQSPALLQTVVEAVATEALLVLRAGQTIINAAVGLGALKSFALDVANLDLKSLPEQERDTVRSMLKQVLVTLPFVDELIDSEIQYVVKIFKSLERNHRVATAVLALRYGWPSEGYEAYMRSPEHNIESLQKQHPMVQMSVMDVQNFRRNYDEASEALQKLVSML